MTNTNSSISAASIFQRSINLAKTRPECIGLVKELADQPPLRSVFAEPKGGTIAQALEKSVLFDRLSMAVAMYLTERFIHWHANTLHINDRNREKVLLGENILSSSAGAEFSPLDFKGRSAPSPYPTSLQLAKEALLSRFGNRQFLYAYLNTVDWTLKTIEEFREVEPPIDGIHFVRIVSENPRTSLCVSVSRNPSDSEILKLLGYGVPHENFRKALVFVNASSAPVSQDELARHLGRHKKNWVFINVWEQLQHS